MTEKFSKIHDLRTLMRTFKDMDDALDTRKWELRYEHPDQRKAAKRALEIERHEMWNAYQARRKELFEEFEKSQRKISEKI